MPTLSELISYSDVINKEEVIIHEERNFENFARMTTQMNSKCSFLTDEKYIAKLDDSISMLITSPDIYEKYGDKFKNMGVCLSSNPKGLYFELLNIYEIQNKRPSFKTKIGKNVSISPTAIIPQENVIIGDNCVIDDFVKICPNVSIGNSVTIQSGSVIGIQDFDLYNYNDISKQVYHNGMTMIYDNVFIGCNCVFGQALYDYGKTIIGKNSKINHGVLIGHNDNIGENTKISKGTIIAGWVDVGKNCFFGVGAMVRNGINIGADVTVGMGSVVTKDIESGLTVIGNPAHPK